RVAQRCERRHLTASSVGFITGGNGVRGVAATACAPRKPRTAAGQPNCSARARAAARRSEGGFRRTLRTPPAKFSPPPLTPAPPIPSGQAPDAPTPPAWPPAHAPS